MHVARQEPQTLQARVLEPPTLQYGPGSRQATIVSRLLLHENCAVLIAPVRHRRAARGTCEPGCFSALVLS